VKKSNSFNFSFLVLVLLFILSQTTLALTAGLNSEDKKLTEEAQIKAILDEIPERTPKYDIDIYGNKIEPGTNVNTQTDGTQMLAAALSAPAGTAAAVQTADNAANASTLVKEIKSVVKYVNADELNVREEANSQSKLVATIKRGDKVTYYETTGEWARIITWTDRKGYILAKFLVDTEKDVQRKEPVKTVAKATTTSRGTTAKAASNAPASAEAQTLTEKIINYAKSLQGVKYVYGGYSTKGFDCSGFTKYVFAKFGISVPRSSGSYWGIGTKVDRSNIRAGDIVLFDTDGGTADVSHVGIYIGGGNFIHASTSKGKVIVMNLNSYRGKYMGARRVIK